MSSPRYALLVFLLAALLVSCDGPTRVEPMEYTTTESVARLVVLEGADSLLVITADKFRGGGRAAVSITR
jgi:hypothetical protein